MPITDLVLCDLWHREKIGFVFGGGGTRERQQTFVASVATQGAWGNVYYPQYQFVLKLVKDEYELVVESVLAGKQPIFRIVTMRLNT